MRALRHTILILLSFVNVSPVRSDDKGAFDPRAKALLEEMVRAYQRVKTLTQESVYESKGSEASRILSSRLVLQRPNRLLLEVHERSPEKGSIVRRFVSDGKDLYSYNELQGYFVKDKAPRDFSGFKELATSIEMAAITGIDPFPALSQQARSAALDPPMTLEGMLCDVVHLDVSTTERTGDVRIYIGQQDHLLRRFVFESAPVAKTEPKEKKLLPDLPDPNAEEPLPPLDPPVPVRFTYQSQVTANGELPKDAFKWIPPAGAMRLMGSPNALLQQSGRAGNEFNGVAPEGQKVAQPQDLSKPTRKVHAKDLFDKAKKQRRD